MSAPQQASSVAPRVILKREKTARVSFAENDSIETIISYEADDPLNVNRNKKKRETGSAETFRVSLELTLPKGLYESSEDFYHQLYNQSKSSDYIRMRSADDRIHKKKELDEQEYINEIESLARLKSAQNKKRKKSVENEKQRVEETIRRRFMHEKEKMYEFDSVKINDSSKLPEVRLKQAQNNNENKPVEMKHNLSILPNLIKSDSPRNTIFEKVKPSALNSITNQLTERERIKNEEALRLRNTIDNLNSFNKEKSNILRSNLNQQSTKPKLSLDDTRQREAELEAKRLLAEETARKVAEIKAQKARLLEAKKQNQYKLDHLKDQKEVKVKRTEEEEEKIREIEIQQKIKNEKQRKKADKQAKKAAEMHAIKIAEEQAKKRLEEERRQAELEQAQRAARLHQDKMALLSHRFLFNEFKNVK